MLRGCSLSGHPGALPLGPSRVPLAPRRPSWPHPVPRPTHPCSALRAAGSRRRRPLWPCPERPCGLQALRRAARRSAGRAPAGAPSSRVQATAPLHAHVYVPEEEDGPRLKMLVITKLPPDLLISAV